MKIYTLKSKITAYLLLIPVYGIGQISTSSNTFFLPNDYVGWNTTAGSPPLNIKTELAQPINFYTFAGNGSYNNLRMIIFDSPSSPFNAGFVGIGPNLATYNPLFNLDVLSTINVNNDGNAINALGIGYHIGGNIVLQIPGTGNTFGGVNTGSNWTTGEDNTFYGTNAGRQNNIGSFNTFIGSNAGSANDVQDFNTYVGNLSGTNNNGSSNSFFGHHSGFNTIGGDFNTFIGEHAGFGSTAPLPTGSHNVFVGNRAGQNYATASDNAIVGDLAGDQLFSGSENAFLGNLSGRFNTLGSRNTFIGFRAGQLNTTGNDITLIGHRTFAPNTPAIANATAIGAGAAVVTDNTMILGQNNVNVGIGLSGNIMGPQTKLEINSNTANDSGLRFRTLTSTSPSVLTGVTAFLTVNGFGDVVLGDIPGAGGSVGACSPGLTNVNFITKISSPNEICRSIGIFEDINAINTIGLGIGVTTNNNFQVHMGGDLLIQPKVSNPGGDIYMQPFVGGTATQRVFAIYGSAGTGVLAIGPSAGNPIQANSSSATGSTFIGNNSGVATQDALNCTFIGTNSGSTFTGSAVAGIGNNTFVGTSSGASATGSFNTFLGTSSGALLATGDFNVLLGGQASGGITSGNDNVLLGYNSNLNAGTGDFNVMLGSRSHGLISGAPISNAVSIGYLNRVSCDNCVSIASHVAGDNLPQQQVGIGFSNPSVQVPPLFPNVETKLYVSSYDGGNNAAYFSGKVYGTAFTVVSDSALKENVQPIGDPFILLNQIEPKVYSYKSQTYPNMGLPNGQHYGFIAQEMELIAPELVNYMAHPAEYDSSGNILFPQVNFRTLNYTELIPVLVSAVKTQKNQLDSLMILISQCCNNPVNTPSGNKSSIPLSNQNIVILNQNTPNPFNENTDINYSIPETVNNAMILFYDQNGKVLQKFEITHRGYGTLTVYGEDLTSGIYSYTLLIDGKNHATKRMVKQ